MSILFVIIIFSILIIAHEFGHFIAARQAKIKVEKFAIGFGPPLFRIKRKETEFLICLFPLGGYVKLAGDNRSEYKGFSYEFLSKAVGVRMRVVFAGPLFNYFLALIIFWIIALVGFPYHDTIVGEVLRDFPAGKAGVRKGDKILEVEGLKVDNWTEMTKIIQKSKDKVSLKIERDGQSLLLDVPLKEKEITDGFGRKKWVSVIGILSSAKIKIIKYSFPRAFLKGFEALFNSTFLIVKGFIFIFLGIIPFKEAVAGPIGIYYIASEAVKVGIVATLHLMAILSVTLAIINLFPIPVLDGGHLLFFLIEKIKKKPLKEKTEDILTRLGLAFIAGLIIFVFYNDMRRFGPKIWNKEATNQEISLDENED